MCLHIASIKFNAGNKTRLFPSPFLIFTSRFLILTEAFRNDYVATCSTEENEFRGYVTVLSPSKTTQRSSTVD